MSIITATYLQILLPNEQAYFIRLEEIFGLLCILYWYAAMIISPLGYVIGKQHMKHIEFARRGIGVSAAYFASLHVVITLWAQLGGISGFEFLPNLFKWSIAGGIVALIILLIMAATSFDKVVTFMTFKRWKLLHRLTYFGGILAVLHVWTIGTHLASLEIQVTAFILLAILSGMECFRVITLFARKRPEFQSKDYFITALLGLWIFWLALILILPNVVHNYHNTHHADHAQHNHGDHS